MQLGVLPHSGPQQKLPTLQTECVADVNEPYPQLRHKNKMAALVVGL